jgi:hypothetical protein
VIEFSATVAVFDSDLPYYDSFYISVFNTESDLLASVVFDNTEEAFGIWRYDGVDYEDTTIAFDHAIAYQLEITIDYAANTWTASLDDMVLFSDAPFTATDSKLDLGDFSVEWEITDIDNPGENWMFFDDWLIKAVGPGGSPGDALAISGITRGVDGQVALTWAAEPDTTYQVEASSGLGAWTSDLPGSTVTTGAREQVGSFVDRSAGAVPGRYYRVRRTGG